MVGLDRDAVALLWLDVEATGTDPSNDRIIELAVHTPSGSRRWLFNPGRPIPPDATAVHGITDEDVRGCPGFDEHAGELQRLLSDPAAVLCGYCSLTYDVPLLDAELRRAGQPGLDLSSTREIDVHRVWMECEPRTLEGALLRWLGEEFVDGHDATADADAARRVFGRIPVTVEGAIGMTRPAWMVDRAKRFIRDDGGRIVFAFGKHEGKPAVHNRDYLEWMLSADFPEETRAWCPRLLEPVEAGA